MNASERGLFCWYGIIDKYLKLVQDTKPMASFAFDRWAYPELTFDDVFILTNNPVLTQVLKICTQEEGNLLDVRTGTPAERFATMLRLAEQYGIGKSISRDTFDLTPKGSLAHIPLAIANMNNVTGQRMAEAIARVGGIAAIPQDKSDDEMECVIDYLRSRNPAYETPVMVRVDAKIHELRRLLLKRGHDTAVVWSEESGLSQVSLDDIPDGVNEDSVITPFINGDVVTGNDGITPIEAIALMERERVHYLPILGKGNQVIGVCTKMGAAMQLRYKPNLDPEGGLNAMYTIGAFNKNPLDRARFLFDRKVRNILIDTAHFDQGVVPYRNIAKIRELALQMGVDVVITAGNVITREATRNILLAGADIVKGGIGPGAMCTTRMVTGVGRPQVSMIVDCAEEAHKQNGLFMADGGIKYPRDVSIALAVGADYVMSGSLFAGTYESPPDAQRDEHGYYKVNRGMAAARSSSLRTGQSLRSGHLEVFRDIVGHRSEGSEGSNVYLKPGKQSAALLAHSLMEGPTSTGTYVGAKNLLELQANAVLGMQTASGFQEGKASERL
jgi:IMP dehydrogenase